jgi:hypothetical protein
VRATRQQKDFLSAIANDGATVAYLSARGSCSCRALGRLELRNFSCATVTTTTEHD